MIRDEQSARQWLSSSLPEATPLAFERIHELVRLLEEENRQQNLVSAASLNEVWSRHVCDSAQLLKYVPRGTEPWLDLGTGAGFPGLVIATLRPECEVVLVESRNRRVEWLTRAAAALGLDRVKVLGTRLELVQAFPVSAISARAFAPLEKLVALSARFSTSSTIWLLPKGRSAAQELGELTGWSHMFHVEQSLTDPDAGIVVGTLAGRTR